MGDNKFIVQFKSDELNIVDLDDCFIFFDLGKWNKFVFYVNINKKIEVDLL